MPHVRTLSRSQLVLPAPSMAVSTLLTTPSIYCAMPLNFISHINQRFQQIMTPAPTQSLQRCHSTVSYERVTVADAANMEAHANVAPQQPHLTSKHSWNTITKKTVQLPLYTPEASAALPDSRMAVLSHHRAHSRLSLYAHAQTKWESGPMITPGGRVWRSVVKQDRVMNPVQLL